MRHSALAAAPVIGVAKAGGAVVVSHRREVAETVITIGRVRAASPKASGEAPCIRIRIAGPGGVAIIRFAVEPAAILNMSSSTAVGFLRPVLIYSFPGQPVLKQAGSASSSADVLALRSGVTV